MNLEDMNEYVFEDEEDLCGEELDAPFEEFIASSSSAKSEEEQQE